MAPIRHFPSISISSGLPSTAIKCCAVRWQNGSVPSSGKSARRPVSIAFKGTSPGPCPCDDLDPPHVTISRLIQRMKGKSSSRLLAAFPYMRKRFWGRHVWARGYFCRSSGNVTDEVIKAYIAQQSHDSDDVFRIEGEASPSGTPVRGPLGRGASPSPLARLSGYGRGFSRNRRLESLCEASAFRRWSIHLCGILFISY